MTNNRTSLQIPTIYRRILLISFFLSVVIFLHITAVNSYALVGSNCNGTWGSMCTNGKSDCGNLPECTCQPYCYEGGGYGTPSYGYPEPQYGSPSYGYPQPQYGNPPPDYGTPLPDPGGGGIPYGTPGGYTTPLPYVNPPPYTTPTYSTPLYSTPIYGSPRPQVQRFDIGGTVFYDYDEDGKQRGKEPGLDHIRVEAHGPDDNHDSTKGNGKYEINNLEEGRYRLEASANGKEKDLKQTKNVNVRIGPNEKNADIGMFAGYEISGRAFYDYDRDGNKEQGEPGLRGDDSSRIEARGIDTGVDDHDDSRGDKGDYTIKGLPSGRYDVIAKKPNNNWKETNRNPRPIRIDFDNVRNENFGFFRGWEIEGHVFNDINEDGKYQNWEPGVGNVRVIGTNIRIRRISDSDLSAPDTGRFILNRNLPEGRYEVKLDPNTVDPVNYDIPGDGTIPPVEIGGNKQNERNADIPLRGRYSISGRVYIDNDQDPQTGYNPANGDTPWIGQPQIAVNGDIRPVTRNDDGTYSIKHLPSGSYTVALVLPSGYVIVHPKVTPPFFQAPVGSVCQPANPPPGGSCDGNGNIINLDFAIAQSQSWLQGYGLDMRFDKGLTNSMPQTPDASCGNGAFVSAPASGTTPGLVFSGQLLNPRSNFGQGQASAVPYNWLVGGTYQETYSGTGGILQTAYDQVMGKLKRSSIKPKPLQGAAPGCSDTGNCTLTGLPQEVYETTGDLTLKAWTVPANTRYVILVGGKLTINNTITVPQNQKASLTFIVRGNIHVAPTVGGTPNPITCPAPDVSQLDGFYSTDASFVLEGTGDCTTEKMLSMQGSLVVNARRGSGTFQNNRDLCGQNSLVPYFTIRERLDLVLNTPDVLKIQNFLYQEVAP